MNHVPGRRTSALTLSALIALAAVAAVLTVPSGARAASAAPACSPSQLVTYVGPAAGGGSAGASTLLLNFSNVGAGACTLRGFPGVSAVDQAGHQLGRAALRSGGGARTITLKPATVTTFGTAAAFVQLEDTGNFPSSRCEGKIASGLKVFAPNTSTPRIVPLPFPACTTSSAVFLKVTAVGSNPG
jgi:hypothetical protein